MDTVLFLSLAVILMAALPWWPNIPYGRSKHHRLRDKQPPVSETKVFDHDALQKAAVKLKALDVRPTPEASQKAAVKVCDSNSETHPMQDDVDLLREFQGRWFARTTPNAG
jgi:hypothetical protein